MRTEGGSFQFSSDPDRLRQLSNRNVFLAGTSNPGLAEKVGRLLQLPVGHPIKKPFADGELNVHIDRNLRRRRVTIFQSTAAPKAPERILEVVLIADAARRGSAGEVTAIFPYYGYGRQDRKDQPRVPISAAAIARMFENRGVNRFITVDLHAKQTQGSVDDPWDDLRAETLLVPVVAKFPSDNLMIVAPDEGAQKLVERYAEALGTNWATISKVRPTKIKNTSSTHGVNGEVSGMDCVIVDDQIDTAGTVINGAATLLAQGAKTVRVVATHAVLSSDAIERIYRSPITEVVLTDTIYPSVKKRAAMQRSGKFTTESVASIIAHAMYANDEGDSISEEQFV